MTQEQLRRQEQDRAFLPQPPPPPLPKGPRRTAWEDLVDTVDTCESATQCDFPFAAEQADPPLSGKILDTINRALGIIELQLRPCPGVVEALPKQPIRQLLLEPLIVDSGCTPGFAPLDDAPFTMTKISRLPPAPLLEDAPLALKEVSYYDDYLGEDFIATTEQLNENFYIGEESGEDIGSSEAAALDVVGEEGASVVPVPFTAAQHSEINKIFTDSFAGFIDRIIGKVQNMITNELQTSFEPVCCDLKNQIELLRNEFAFKFIPVQTGMKRYCFKRNSGNLQPE